MAVIYPKLGGCLEVTTKLGPLARTDLWAGVKGLLDKLMTHLGLGSSLVDPWGSLLGVVGVPSCDVSAVCHGGSAILLGSLGCPMPGRMPKALPGWPNLITYLTCLWIDPSFPRGRMSICLGRTASFPRRKVSNCLGGTASFPGRKVSSCWGRIAYFPMRKVSNCLGRTASQGRRQFLPGNCSPSFWGRKQFLPGKYSSFPGGRKSQNK